MAFSVNNNNSPANPYTQAERTQGFTVSDVFKFVNDAVARAKQDLNQIPASTPSLKQINATVISPSHLPTTPSQSDDKELAQILVFGGMFAACFACVMFVACLASVDMLFPKKNSAKNSARV